MSDRPNTAVPAFFEYTKPAPVLVAQGAEAVIYRSHFLSPSRPCALKYRPAKKWRHPILDARLTRHRILAEARILVKCRRDGVPVPGVLALDWNGSTIVGKSDTVESSEPERTGGWMMVEWIEGTTVRAALERWVGSVQNAKDVERSPKWHEGLQDLLTKVGQTVGKLHSIGVVHGDLTTSNIMLRPATSQTASENDNKGVLPAEFDTEPSLDGEVVLIDFGLATQTVLDEDRAVDLYVLERAFGSTHPTIEDMFSDILQAYGMSYKGSKAVLKKLEEVRMRGRKRSMLG